MNGKPRHHLASSNSFKLSQSIFADSEDQNNPKFDSMVDHTTVSTPGFTRTVCIFSNAIE